MTLKTEIAVAGGIAFLAGLAAAFGFHDVGAGWVAMALSWLALCKAGNLIRS